MAHAGITSDSQSSADQMGVDCEVKSRRAIFLDRDGVLNAAIVRKGVPHPPLDADETQIIEGVRGAISQLERSGYVCVVVTNQPDIARGKTSLQTVNSINQKVADETGIVHFYVCPHDTKDACVCRKPLPGLLLQAAEELNLDLASSFMVGDRWRDVEAGRMAGVRTFFIDYGYDEQAAVGYDWKVYSLAEASAVILELTER